MPERILYRDVITFPPLRQDLAFVVDEGVPAGELLAAAREAAGEELREARFLSDYRGDQIPAGKKSVAFAVAFQSPERTLSDEDATRLRACDRRSAGGALRRRAARLTSRRFEASEPGSDPAPCPKRHACARARGSRTAAPLDVPPPAGRPRRTSERLTNRLDAPDLSTARRVTTNVPFVRNRDAGTQLRVAVVHEFGTTEYFRTYASVPRFESRSITETAFAPSSHTREARIDAEAEAPEARGT